MQKNISLLLIDLQNDFLDSNGILAGVVKDQIEDSNLIDKINSLTEAARKNKVKVIYAPIAFSFDHAELGKNPYGIAKIVKDTGAFKENKEGSKICSKLNVAAEDMVLPYKKSISVFKTTDLDKELRAKNINTLVIAGLLTDACMLATVIEAYDLGYNVVTVINATAATSEESRENTIKNIFPLFSKTMTDKEVIELFKQ